MYTLIYFVFSFKKYVNKKRAGSAGRANYRNQNEIQA